MPLGELGMQIASAATGGVLGRIFGGLNDARQLRQQEKLQALQEAGNKRMMDYSMVKQLQMWKDTNYGPQMEQIKAAGLSPGLIYGMKGGGGISTGSPGGNVSGANAPSGGGEMIAATGMGMQMQLMKAQKENIEADTANKLADAQNKPLQGENIKADTALKQINWNIQAIEEDIKGATSNAAKATVMYQMNQAFTQMNMLKNEGKISDATVQDKIDLIKREAIGALLKNVLTKAETANVSEDTKLKSKQILTEGQKFDTMVGELMMAWNRDGRDGARLILQQLAGQDDDFIKQVMGVIEEVMGSAAKKRVQVTNLKMN